jgi:hypothetical protein
MFGANQRPVGSKVVCVWGMHRSGTSALTGVLGEWGVHLGDVRTESGFNLKGNRENPEIRRLNDDVLKTSGGSWHELPEKVLWYDEQRKKRDQILLDYEKKSLWGFKDPRLLFTIDGWLEKISDVQFIGTFRNPLLVAESLRKRNGFTLNKAVALWERYNEQLLLQHERFGFPIVSFDHAEPVYRRSLDKLFDALTALGLPLKKNETSFFAEELRHTEVDSSVELPPAVSQLYTQLQTLAL